MTKTSSSQEVRSNGVRAGTTVPAAVKRYGVFLVEDHPITQAGLAALIGREDDLFICGEADSAPAALDQIAKLKPSIVISDIALKTSNGIELRSEEHTSELQSRFDLVCRLLLEKKKTYSLCLLGW